MITCIIRFLTLTLFIQSLCGCYSTFECWRNASHETMLSTTLFDIQTFVQKNFTKIHLFWCGTIKMAVLLLRYIHEPIGAQEKLCNCEKQIIIIFTEYNSLLLLSMLDTQVHAYSVCTQRCTVLYKWFQHTPPQFISVLSQFTKISLLYFSQLMRSKGVCAVRAHHSQVQQNNCSLTPVTNYTALSQMNTFLLSEQ